MPTRTPCHSTTRKMLSVFSLSAVDSGFEPRSGQTKVCNIGICCFSVKYVYTTLRKKSTVY